MMNLSVAFFALMLIRVSEGSTLTAASCSQADVQSKIDIAQREDTIIVPAGTCTWTKGIATSKGITIQGAGCTYDSHDRPTACDTIIIDNFTSPDSFFRLDTKANESYRISSFEFKTVRSKFYSVGALSIIGDSNSIRVDHNRFNRPKNTQIRTNGYVRGVVDHNVHLVEREHANQMWHATWAGGKYGDGSWSDPIDWGGPNAWYLEDNYYEGTNGVIGTVTDTYAGARFVARYNTLVNTNFATHGTADGAGINRGLRQFEIYGNTITYNPKSSKNTVHIRGGTGIYYNNTHINVFKTITLHYYRFGRRSCNEFDTPTGLSPFDINDPHGVYLSSVAGSGSGNNTLKVAGAKWTKNQWRAYQVYVPVSAKSPSGFFASIVISNTEDTITVEDNNFPDTCPHEFVAGEAFEIRRILLGLDQPGAGTSDPMTRSGSKPVPSNVNQQYDPVYVWGNVLNGAKDLSKETFNPTNDIHKMGHVTPYDGTTGMGMGLMSDRPKSPTLLNTAYFATDFGSDGTLFVWKGTAWETRWSPYVYPHHLVSGKAPVSSPTYAISVIKSGTGSGTITGSSIACGATCTQTKIKAGTQITLLASPSANSSFAGWSGGGCGASSTCIITVNSDTSVTATFNLGDHGSESATEVASSTVSESATTEAALNFTPILGAIVWLAHACIVLSIYL